MFKSLEFTVTFASTKRTLQDKHVFKDGLTAISGANEQGKSMRLEMLRYALFGTDALRAAATEYTKLHVTCSFEIDGVDYTVVRKNTTTLQRGQETVASGAKAVNTKITETLGYGLEIFDLVNNCAQGEVERLSTLRPAQRKQLIERTAGLEAIDTVIKKIKAEGDALSQEAKGARLGLVDIGIRPKEPGDLPTEEKLKADIEFYSHKLAGMHQAQGVLQLPLPKMPTIPSVTPLPGELKVEDLEGLKADLNGLIATRRLVQEKQNAAGRFAQPDLTLADIDTLEATLARQPALQEAWNDYRRRQALLDAGQMKCPCCGETFYVEHEHLKALPDVPEPTEHPLDVRMAQQQTQALLVQRERHRGMEARAALLAEATEIERLLAEGPSETSLRMAIGQIEEHLRQVRAAEQAQAAYAAAQESLQALLERQAAARLVVLDAEGVPTQLQELRDKLTQRQAYNAQLKAWQDATRRNQELASRIEALESEAEGWAAGVAALHDLKARVKAHLAPSLSAIASGYIAQMTDGLRTSIHVSEDFSIRVDGQPVETLSGSAKAVTNLALRVSLGLVLAAKRFSVFLGDEVDASMDDGRAEATVDALRSLRGQIRQIILVSHKPTEADHQLTL